MKKAYETPMVDKIAFNYRDQVVAASAGGTTGDSSSRTEFLDICPITDQISEQVSFWGCNSWWG